MLIPPSRITILHDICTVNCMKLTFAILLSFSVALTYGQIDNNIGDSNGINIPFGTDTGTTPNISNTSLSTKPLGLDNPDNKTGFGQYIATDTLSIGETKDEGIKFTTDNGLMTRKSNTAPKYFTKDKVVKEKFRQNQFFGTYESDAKYVVLRCRDHEFVDGDRVKVYVNGNVLVPGVNLTSAFKEFDLFLDPGTNKIEIEALNQGASGPNTAEFIIIDDDGTLLFSNEWNLATGVRASFIIYKPQQ